ncbi:hypothetical protein JCM15415_21970 [Methanobacterium movens]
MIQKKLIQDTPKNTIVEISRNSPNFPYLLNNIKDSPDQLYAIGNTQLLNMPSVAIVGTRKPTKDAAKAAENIARLYGKNGFIIVSGLALGVDSIAMKSALKVEAPVIGVLPSSVDNIVPKKNIYIANKILEKNGLLISERNNGSNVQNYHYIKRNRIISGISMAVIVVETATKGGTMHTVNFAKEQIRPILVVDLPAEGNQKLKKESYPIISINTNHND